MHQDLFRRLPGDAAAEQYPAKNSVGDFLRFPLIQHNAAVIVARR